LEKVKILLVLATLSVLWDSSFLAIKVVIDAILPLLVFGIRFVIAGLPLLFFYKFKKKLTIMLVKINLKVLIKEDGK